MELKQLLKELETHINTRMEEFTSLGQECKKLQKQVSDLQDKMAKIFMSLEPVHPIIRHQHPEMNDLFDALLEIAEDKK